MDSPDRYKSTLSFVDLLFNILLGFVFLFIVAFILINPVARKGDIIVPAEYIIVMTWNEDSEDDVDLWVRDPDDQIVSFTSREIEGMSLDRDDLGSTTDVVVVNGNPRVIPINREVITIRGSKPGTYLVTAHMYQKHSPDPVDVNIEVVKLNPYQVVYQQTQTMTTKGQERNFYQFTIDSDGDYGDITVASESAIRVRVP